MNGKKEEDRNTKQMIEYVEMCRMRRDARDEKKTRNTKRVFNKKKENENLKQKMSKSR